jgi:hypothetical protein
MNHFISPTAYILLPHRATIGAGARWDTQIAIQRLHANQEPYSIYYLHMLGKLFLSSGNWISFNIWIVHQVEYVEEKSYILHLMQLLASYASLALGQQTLIP